MADTTLSNAFITLNDVINNFLISYTGPGKLIPDAVRTEVIFHARRCLQEFAYETIKSQFVSQYTGDFNNFVFTLMSDFVAVISIDLSSVAYTGPLSPVDKLADVSQKTYFINVSNEAIGAAPANSITYSPVNPGTGTYTFTYLSNALTTDESAAIPKLAEEALYSCIIYAILANREKTRPDVLQRLLIEKTDKLERAKSRLVFTNFD